MAFLQNQVFLPLKFFFCTMTTATPPFWMSFFRSSFGLALISGLLLAFSWYLFLFIFVGFVPLLWAEARAATTAKKCWRLRWLGWVYLAMVIWNTGATWWIVNASPFGVVFAVLVNAWLMTLPFWFYSLTKQYINPTYGLFGWVLYWVSYEYLHLDWDLSWPWLQLGNVFAPVPWLVQWYEITGVLGGAIWVLLANIFILGALVTKNRRYGYAFAFWLILPALGSYLRYVTYTQQGSPVEVVVVQPNIDPYTEKFIGSTQHIPADQQVARFLALAASKATFNTRLVAFPEVALTEFVHEPTATMQTSIAQLNQFVQQNPQTALLIGATTYLNYPNAQKATVTARFTQDLGYFDVFNSAIFLQANQAPLFYHKSKLTPGVEIMPFATALKFMNDYMLDFGGMSGSLGTQEERTVLKTNTQLQVAPVICYESVYGDFVGRYSRKQAQLICIITNDAWWGNTPGHRQHFQYARLRAIENRKDVLRSANTGISGFINQRGDILQKSQYWTQDCLRATLQANDQLTFYARYGDYLGRLSLFVAVALFLTGWVRYKVGGVKKGLSLPR